MRDIVSKEQQYVNTVKNPKIKREETGVNGFQSFTVEKPEIDLGFRFGLFQRTSVMPKSDDDLLDYSESDDKSEPHFSMDDGAALCILGEDVNVEPKLEDELVVNYNLSKLIFEDKYA